MLGYKRLSLADFAVVADISIEEGGEPDEEGRFFGGGLNTEQRVGYFVCLAHHWER